MDHSIFLIIFCIIVSKNITNCSGQCSKTTCKNGGVCVDNQDFSSTCHCEIRFTGPLCGISLELSCSDEPCEFGTCTTEDHTSFCVCDEGYTGTFCEEVCFDDQTFTDARGFSCEDWGNFICNEATNFGYTRLEEWNVLNFCCLSCKKGALSGIPNNGSGDSKYLESLNPTSHKKKGVEQFPVWMLVLTTSGSGILCFALCYLCYIQENLCKDFSERNNPEGDTRSAHMLSIRSTTAASMPISSSKRSRSFTGISKDSESMSDSTSDYVRYTVSHVNQKNELRGSLTTSDTLSCRRKSQSDFRRKSSSNTYGNEFTWRRASSEYTRSRTDTSEQPFQTETNIASLESLFIAGDIIIILENFETDSENSLLLEKDMIFYVTEIDEDGDMSVTNGCWTRDQWIAKYNFSKLLKLTTMAKPSVTVLNMTQTKINQVLELRGRRRGPSIVRERKSVCLSYCSDLESSTYILHSSQLIPPESPNYISSSNFALSEHNHTMSNLESLQHVRKEFQMGLISHQSDVDLFSSQNSIENCSHQEKRKLKLNQINDMRKKKIMKNSTTEPSFLDSCCTSENEVEDFSQDYKEVIRILSQIPEDDDSMCPNSTSINSKTTLTVIKEEQSSPVGSVSGNSHTQQQEDEKIESSGDVLPNNDDEFLQDFTNTPGFSSIGGTTSELVSLPSIDYNDMEGRTQTTEVCQTSDELIDYNDLEEQQSSHSNVSTIHTSDLSSSSVDKHFGNNYTRMIGKNISRFKKKEIDQQTHSTIIENSTQEYHAKIENSISNSRLIQNNCDFVNLKKREIDESSDCTDLYELHCRSSFHKFDTNTPSDLDYSESMSKEREESTEKLEDETEEQSADTSRQLESEI